MSFPGSIQITVLTGYFGTVTPSTGRISIVPSTRFLTDTVDQVTVPNTPYSIVLGTTALGWSNGAITSLMSKPGWFSQPVIATDSPDLSPSGWEYSITVDLDGWERPFIASYLIPYSGGTVDFSTLTPL